MNSKDKKIQKFLQLNGWKVYFKDKETICYEHPESQYHIHLYLGYTKILDINGDAKTITIDDNTLSLYCLIGILTVNRDGSIYPKIPLT